MRSKLPKTNSDAKKKIEKPDQKYLKKNSNFYLNIMKYN